MEIRIIDIEDLEIGDEIAIACQSHFKYLRVLSLPKENGKTHYYTKKPLYKSVRCSSRREEIIRTNVWNGKTYTNTRKEFEWKFTPDDHNVTLNQDLNYRDILLIKRRSEF